MEELKIGDRVKVLLVSGGDFNNSLDYELGVITNISDLLGYCIKFDNDLFSSTYYDKEELQKIEVMENKKDYISKDKIRHKIMELELQNKIPIKDYKIMYDIIKRDFQIQILRELLEENK